MSANLRKKLQLLSIVSSVKNPKLRKEIAKNVAENDDVFDALHEVCYNTMKGKLKLSKKQKKGIGCRAVRCLAKPPTALKVKRNRRKVVSQLGSGFWTFLIPMVIDLLANKVQGN